MRNQFHEMLRDLMKWKFSISGAECEDAYPNSHYINPHWACMVERIPMQARIKNSETLKMRTAYCTSIPIHS